MEQRRDQVVHSGISTGLLLRSVASVGMADTRAVPFRKGSSARPLCQVENAEAARGGPYVCTRIDREILQSVQNDRFTAKRPDRGPF